MIAELQTAARGWRPPRVELSRPQAWGLAIALLLIITLVDWLTGYELGLFVFYFAPVSIASWYLGRRPGLGFAAAAAAGWYVSDRLSGHPYSRAFLIYWETGMRFVSFLTTAWTLWTIREGQRWREAAREALSGDVRSSLRTIAAEASALGDDPGEPARAGAAAVLDAARRIGEVTERLLAASGHPGGAAAAPPERRGRDDLAAELDAGVERP